MLEKFGFAIGRRCKLLLTSLNFLASRCTAPLTPCSRYEAWLCCNLCAFFTPAALRPRGLQGGRIQGGFSQLKLGGTEIQHEAFRAFGLILHMAPLKIKELSVRTLCHVAVQKCGDSAFCKTLRGKAGDGYELRPGSIAVKGSALKAKLVNAAVQKEIDLTLTAYEGLVRLTIDEGDKDRFKVV